MCTTTPEEQQTKIPTRDTTSNFQSWQHLPTRSDISVQRPQADVAPLHLRTQNGDGPESITTLWIGGFRSQRKEPTQLRSQLSDVLSVDMSLAKRLSNGSFKFMAPKSQVARILELNGTSHKDFPAGIKVQKYTPLSQAQEPTKRVVFHAKEPNLNLRVSVPCQAKTSAAGRQIRVILPDGATAAGGGCEGHSSSDIRRGRKGRREKRFRDLKMPDFPAFLCDLGELCGENV